MNKNRKKDERRGKRKWESPFTLLAHHPHPLFMKQCFHHYVSMVFLPLPLLPKIQDTHNLASSKNGWVWSVYSPMRHLTCLRTFWFPREFIANNGHSFHCTACFKMRQQFFWCCRIIDLSHIDGMTLHEGNVKERNRAIGGSQHTWAAFIKGGVTNERTPTHPD